LSFISVSDNFSTKLFHVRDEKSSSTHAGSGTSGSFIKRTLNTTLTNEISGASISSSVITLPAGTYFIHAYTPAQYVNKHRAKLRNTSDSTDTILGTSERSSTNDTTSSFVRGRFTIASSKNFELQHRIETSRDVDDLGSASGFSITEVYADVQIWKVA
jgi:hypothetical protein